MEANKFFLKDYYLHRISNSVQFNQIGIRVLVKLLKAIVRNDKPITQLNLTSNTVHGLFFLTSSNLHRFFCFIVFSMYPWLIAYKNLVPLTKLPVFSLVTCH